MADLARTPGPVPKEALAYFRGKDLRVGFNHRDVWRQEHAHAFTVAKAMRLDILDDIREAVDQALAGGETLEQFKKALMPKLAEKGWWGRSTQTDPLTGEKKEVQLGSPRRLKTIYDANLRSARAAGQWERVQRTKQALPYLIYELGPSKEHRLEHVTWDGTILPVDHPWWQDHMPPNGWGCKCRVRQISAAERDRLVASGDYSTDAPARRPRRFINKRTGEEIMVDAGLSPDWAGNPGQDRVRAIREQLNQKIESTDQQLARASVNNLFNGPGPVIDEYIKDRKGELAAGILDRDLQRALGSESQVVRLSIQALQKQDKSQADLTVDDYRLLPEIISGAIAIEQPGGRIALFKQVGDRWWKATVEASKGRDKTHLVSYQKTDADEVRRETSGKRVLRGSGRN